MTPPTGKRCSSCQYDLSGLPAGRVCPECGTLPESRGGDLPLQPIEVVTCPECGGDRTGLPPHRSCIVCGAETVGPIGSVPPPECSGEDAELETMADRCSACGYDLRNLPEPRVCPECGSTERSTRSPHNWEQHSVEQIEGGAMGWLVRGVMSATEVVDITPLMDRVPQVWMGFRGLFAVVVTVLVLQIGAAIGVIGIGPYRFLMMAAGVVWAMSLVVTFSRAFDLVMPGRTLQRVIARWSGWLWVLGFFFWFVRGAMGGGDIDRPFHWPLLWVTHFAALMGTVVTVGYLAALAGGLDLWSARRRLTTVAWLVFPMGIIQWIFPWKQVAAAGVDGGFGMFLAYIILLACVPMWWLLFRTSTALWEILHTHRWSRLYDRRVASRSERVDAARAKIDARVASQVRATPDPSDDIEVE
jgi:hypothetical protein